MKAHVQPGFIYYFVFEYTDDSYTLPAETNFKILRIDGDILVAQKEQGNNNPEFDIPMDTFFHFAMQKFPTQ